MRKKTTNAFLELSLSETETYALLNAVSAALVQADEEAKKEPQGSSLRFENFAREIYIRALSDVFAALKAAVDEEIQN